MKTVRVVTTLFFLFVSCAIPVAGAGRKEAPFADASGLRNWEKTFDISDKKPGVYNIVVEGKDQAGNVTIAGPINVYVDPKTDLPVAAIANPIPGMRVLGDLNVVGTCVDDDGVSKVELKLDGGEWFAAQGKEFWSFYFKGVDVSDGRHTLTARGIDVNGLPGPERTVTFDMDKRRPVETIESPAAGTLVAGRVSLRGGVFDANGVNSVEYSLDGGKTFTTAGGSYDGKTNIRSFSADIDTRKMPDGPSVAWLKSRDGVGSVALAPVLLVVDNTKPAIDLIYPGTEDAVDGTFTLFGTSKDEVGLKSISWKIGGQGGDIAVNPGDPFWVVPVKLADPRGKETTVVLTAVDTIGNKTEVRRRVALDLEADKPRVTLLSPAAAFRSEGSVLLAGFARDDDGTAAVEYWVDSGKPERIETSGAFAVRLSDLPPGARTLSVRAIDINGVAGPAVPVRIEEIGPPPSVEIREVLFDQNAKDGRVEPFRSGVDLVPDGKAAFRLSVKNAQYQPSRISSAEWKLTGPKGSGGVNGTVRVASDGSALLPLPKDTPFGILELTVSVKDSFGRTASAAGLVRVADLSAVRGEPSFEFVDERAESDGTVRFAPTDAGRRPFSGRFVGAALASVRLEPENPLFSVSSDGPFVSVLPKGGGADGSFVLVAKTDRGHEFRSRQFRFLSDLSGPKITLDDTRPVFVGVSARISGSIEDSGGVESCSYSIGSSSEPTALALAADGRFETDVNLGGVSDGPVRLTVKAVDRAGNTSEKTIDWSKDAEGPSVEFVLPSASVPAAGIAAGFIRDSGGVASVSFAADGSSFAPIENREAFVVRFDPASASRARLKVTDRAGNERLVELPASAPSAVAGHAPAKGESPAAEDQVPPAVPAGADPKAVPVLAVVSPSADAVIAGPVPVVFTLSAPRAVASVSWSFGAASGEIDTRLLVPLNGQSAADRGGEFVCAFVASGITQRAGQPRLRLIVKDASGKSADVSLSVKAEPERLKPVLTVTAPAEDETLKSSIVVSASAVSERGTAAYRFSLDGGEAKPVESAGTGVLKLEGLAAGRHYLTVAAVDSFGLESSPVKRTFRVVGDAPVVSFASIARKDAKEDFRPGAAVATEAGVWIEGSAKAPNGLSSVEASIAGRPPVRASIRRENQTDYTFFFYLPNDLPYARSDIALKATDSAGLTAEAASFIYRVAALPASGVFETPGLYALDTRVEDAGGGAIRVANDAPLRLRFIGRPLAAAALDPPSELLSVSVDGSSVILTPKADGTLGPTSLKAIDADGDEFSWGPHSFEIHRSDPKLEIASPASDGWYRDEAPLSASVTDAAGKSELTYSFDGLAWLPVPPDARSASSDARPAALPLEGADGGILLRFRAANAAGRSVTVERVVNKDTVPPAGFVVAPRSSDAVNGRTTIASRFSDGGKLASVEFSADGEKWEKAETPEAVSRMVDFSAAPTPPKPMFRAVDAAGNSMKLDPAFVPDAQADKPRTLIQLPQEMEVVRSDFSVSGAAFDDDGVAAVHYRFDGGDWVKLPLAGNGFSIPVSFSGAADNEHTVEVYAEDIYGVIGETAARKYRVSREEPKASVSEPKMETTVRGIVEIRGGAADANGIGEVELSFDNAVTFSRAVVTKSDDPASALWVYRLDTRILRDGLHSLYVRPKDGYGTEGFFASLVSVDNTPPELSLDLPADGAVANGRIDLSGRVADSRGLGSLSAVVYPLSPNGTPERRFDLDTAAVISKTLDLGAFKDGPYGLRLSAVDKSGNETVVTRDFSVKAGSRDEYILLASPVSGERLSGKIRVQGRVRSPARVLSVSVLVDGSDFVSAAPDKNGWFSADLSTSAERLIASGRRALEVRFVNSEGAVVTSGPVELDFLSEGPWTMADSFAPGAYVPYRPYLSGTAGWTAAETPPPADAAAIRKAYEDKRGREVVSVEVSVDNGRTFAFASGREKWSCRLETQTFSEGSLPVIVRARFRNGESAASKLYLNLDKTPPKISIVSPGEGGRFNGRIAVSGTASDDVELTSVALALREGDKAGYELPSFIQGMYVDAHVFGEPVYEAGAGFTFFGDNVKLQFAYGYTPETFLGQDRGRFHGNVFSAKLLANLVSFPFAFWLGPDWEFLSANFAVGANFSYFSQTQTTTLGSSSGTVIGAVVAQLEFPKMKFKNWSMFRTYSFYLEGQAWFVSAELDGGIKPSFATGVRVGIF